MKIILKLIREHADRLHSENDARKLKPKYEKVATNGKAVLLWTGRCDRLPRKSIAAKHAQKAGVKRVVIICPPTSKHIWTTTLTVKKGIATQGKQKAWIMRP